MGGVIVKCINELIKENKMSRTKIDGDKKVIVNACIKFMDSVNHHIMFKRFIAFFLSNLGIRTGVIALVCRYTPKKTREIRNIKKLYAQGGAYEILPKSHSGRKKKITPEIHTLIIKLMMEYRTSSARKISTILFYKYNIDICYKVIEKEINVYGLKGLLEIDM